MNLWDIRRTGLVAFVHGECVNHCNSYGYCLCLDDSEIVHKKLRPLQEHEICLVQRAKQCQYFERILLPIAKQQGIYEKIVRQYKKFSKSFQKDNIRKCPDCGTELLHRQRVCDNCRKKRRQKTKRENQRKYRKKNRV